MGSAAKAVAYKFAPKSQQSVRSSTARAQKLTPKSQQSVRSSIARAQEIDAEIAAERAQICRNNNRNLRRNRSRACATQSKKREKAKPKSQIIVRSCMKNCMSIGAPFPGPKFWKNLALKSCVVLTIILLEIALENRFCEDPHFRGRFFAIFPVQKLNQKTKPKSQILVQRDAEKGCQREKVRKNQKATKCAKTRV